MLSFNLWPCFQVASFLQTFRSHFCMHFPSFAMLSAWFAHMILFNLFILKTSIPMFSWITAGTCFFYRSMNDRMLFWIRQATNKQSEYRNQAELCTWNYSSKELEVCGLLWNKWMTSHRPSRNEEGGGSRRKARKLELYSLEVTINNTIELKIEQPAYF
jgi:hypothetical protein